MLKKIKVGIIGMGYIGESHIEAVRRIGCCELYAIADTNAELAKAKADYYGIEKCYSSVEELLSDPNIDAVHNCTPNFLHLEINKEIIKSGKHLLSEKPLCMNYEEAKELINQMFEVVEEQTQGQEQPEEDVTENNKIKIEILNGTSANSTLSAVNTILKQKNYKILKTGNTTISTFTTIIANGETDEAVAEKIKDILGVGTVLTTTSTASKADITIIIGEDFNK